MKPFLFRYHAPAPEEWRAFAVQAFGSLGAFAVLLCFPAVRSNSTVLCGVAVGVVYLLTQSALVLWKKWRRARIDCIEVAPEALRVSGSANFEVLWRDVLRCEAVENRVRVVWKKGFWEFAPREIIEGQTLLSEINTRAKPNFIALEAK
ncbi:MAG TPA: hypothetical protein VF681_02050 [Abditibacteriaceae bacterium]|jgi:hypothetical protein